MYPLASSSPIETKTIKNCYISSETSNWLNGLSSWRRGGTEGKFGGGGVHFEGKNSAEVMLSRTVTGGLATQIRLVIDAIPSPVREQVLSCPYKSPQISSIYARCVWPVPKNLDVQIFVQNTCLLKREK